MNYYNEPERLDVSTIDGIVTGSINTNRIYLTSEPSSFSSELRGQIDALRAENHMLKTRVDDLEATVEAIGKAILNID